jgi:hypothetical protein
MHSCTSSSSSWIANVHRHRDVTYGEPNEYDGLPRASYSTIRARVEIYFRYFSQQD